MRYRIPPVQPVEEACRDATHVAVAGVGVGEDGDRHRAAAALEQGDLVDDVPVRARSPAAPIWPRFGSSSSRLLARRGRHARQRTDAALPRLEKRPEPVHDSSTASSFNREAGDTVTGNGTTAVLVAGERRIELATAGFGRLISLAKEMAFAVEGIILVTHAEDARCWRNARCARGPGRKWKRCRGARV
jgi:hypothetical protein